MIMVALLPTTRNNLQLPYVLLFYLGLHCTSFYHSTGVLVAAWSLPSPFTGSIRYHPSQNQNQTPTLAPTRTPTPPTSHLVSRRGWWTTATTAVVAGLATTSTVANAACLPGDLNKDCIGVYKVPIDDRMLPYVSTPEALHRFAPDITYVPPIASPDTVGQALEILQSQRLAADDIASVVQAGRLEEAGIKLLNLVPKVSTSGQVVVKTAQTALSDAAIAASTAPSALEELIQSKLQSQLEVTLVSWGESDIMMGQGLRGDLGVSAVAQIQLLKQLQEATGALDDFLVLAMAVQKNVNASSTSGGGSVSASNRRPASKAR